MKKFLTLLMVLSMLTGVVQPCIADDEDVVQNVSEEEKEENDEEYSFAEPEKEYVLAEKTDAYEAVIYDNSIPRSRFMEEYQKKEGRPHLFLSEEEGDEGNIPAVNFEGKDCLFFNGKKYYAYGKAPAEIEESTKNVAVKVTFYDRYTDWVRYTYTRPTGSLRNAMILKSGTDTWRTETVLLNDSVFRGAMKHGSDFYLNSYESSYEMMNDYIADVEFVNLDQFAGAVTAEGKKKNVIQQGTHFLLNSMGLFDKNTPLEDRADGETAAKLFQRITGKSCALSGDVTMEETIRAFSDALGIEGTGETDWVASGIVRNMERHAPKWFGETPYKTQTHGFYDIEAGGYQRGLFYDDLVGLCYNLLFLKDSDGESFLAKLCEDEAVFQGMAYTNDRDLMYTYYEERGYRIYEASRTDEITGETIREFYAPGVNINIPYINEWCTVDSKNFVFCAGVDKHFGTGNPVVYNRETGKTVTVDNRRIKMFAQVLSEDNVMYYTVNSEVWAYDIKTREKKMLWQEPNGAVLQEIPTITRDGKYLCVFWGSENKSYPDHIGILNTETGELKSYLGKKWVDNHLYGPNPIFVGHVIIDPADETIVQFLHGGGSSVEDRMWFLDTKTNKTWKAPDMSRRFDGGWGEQCVHWVWSLDGKKVYYCRMSTQSLASKPGVVYYDFENPQNGVIQVNDSYPYAHAVPDATDQLFVGDSYKLRSDGFYKSEVVLYDSVSDYAKLLSYHSIWNSHPCHSHPTFSLDSSMIFFNQAYERDNSIRVGMIEVEETIKKMRSEGNRKHYTTASVRFDEKKTGDGVRVRDDAENGTPRAAKLNGEPCLALEYGKTLYVDVDGEYVLTGDQRVNLKITYFDNGYEPFQMNYNSSLSSEVGRLKNSKTIYIPRRNTNQWVTRDIVLNDASFRSALSGSYDFSLNIMPDSNNAYIKEISATALR